MTALFFSRTFNPILEIGFKQGVVICLLVGEMIQKIKIQPYRLAIDHRSFADSR
jgi:hypothetical protein